MELVKSRWRRGEWHYFLRIVDGDDSTDEGWRESVSAIYDLNDFEIDVLIAGLMDIAGIRRDELEGH